MEEIKRQAQVASSGLKKSDFHFGYRSLTYSKVDNQLLVEAPFEDKTALKRLGGVWLAKPIKRWSWYCNEKNLTKLLDEVPFDFLDESIEQIILDERERLEKIRALKDVASQDVPISLKIPGIKTTETVSLRNYQKLGVQFGTLVNTGVLIGDEMGLGKSLSAIGISLWKKSNENVEKVLVIAPASVKYNWEEEIRLWTNERYVIIDGPFKKRQELWDSDCFFTVVNPELVVRDISKVEALMLPWDMIIVDEIHMLKCWSSQRSKEIKKLKIRPGGLRIGTSGTPIDGRLEHLHSIFEFLVPGLFECKTRFLDRHAMRDYWGNIVGYRDVNDVKDTIYPHFIRRLKKDVVKELPEKIFKTEYVEFTPDERKVYKSLIKCEHEITEESQAAVVVIRARQFCDSPGLLDLQPEFGSKFERATELIQEAIENGEKLLVFTMFEKMVQKLLRAFNEKKWRCLSITGATSAKERPAIARRFNEDPEVDVCVMDEAGSTGLNFQEASYVFHYDDNWAPAIMKQRTDRAHRLTTKHVVTVVNFVCKDTIEDRVRELLMSKDRVSAEALGDNLNDVLTIRPSVSFRKALKLL